MSRDSIQYSKWRCYIDGVQVPLITASVSFGINQNPMAQIMIEPDPLLIRVRPKCVVSLWFYDQHDPVVRKAHAAGRIIDDEDVYKLYFEGELESIQYNKTPDSRNFTLLVSGFMGILNQFPMFMGGVGKSFDSPLVSGSFFFQGVAPEGNTADFFSKVAFGNIFGTQGAPKPNVPTVAWRETKRGGFAQRLLSVINYLGAFNASARLQIARTRLMGKICGIEDSLFQNLLQLSLAGTYFGRVAEQIDANASFADVVNMLRNAAFYDMASIPAPFYDVTFNRQPGPSRTPLPELFKLNQLYAIPRPFLRNDFVFMPNLYYAMPPRCNFVFPDMITSLTRTRSFMNEPTRLLIQDPYVTQGDVAILAPVPPVRPSALQGTDAGNLKPTAIWTSALEAIQNEPVGDQVTSPYQIQLSNTVYNGLQMLRDEEIEKGLLLSRNFPAFEFFSALAASLSRDNGATGVEAAARSTQRDVAAFLTGAAGGDKTRGQRWLEIMQSAANYQLDLQRQTRDIRVTCVGLRHLAPGFNAVIMDTTVSYFGRVESVTLDIDPSGMETTTLTCGMVREVPPPVVTRPAQTVTTTNTVVSFAGLPAYLRRQSARATEAFNTLTTGIPARTLSDQIINNTASVFTAKLHLTAVLEAIRAKRTALARSFTENDIASASAATLDNTMVARLLNAATFDLAVVSIVDAGKLVSRFYADDIRAADAAATSGQTSTVELLGFTPQTTTTTTTSAIDSNPDWPAPPAHFPQEWLNPETLDAAHLGLLGVKPFYSDTGASFAYTDGDVTGVTVSQQTYFSNTQEMIAKIDKIFPVIPRFEQQAVTDTSEWGRRTADTTPTTPVLDWEFDEYHWRPAMTLGQYLATHGLDTSLVPDRSDSGVRFTVMAATSPDNSIFSKIVDDNALLGLNASDPAVDAIRAETADVANLSTADRQKLWIAYAKRHFGGRAFQGF